MSSFLAESEFCPTSASLVRRGGNRDEDGVLELVCWSDELAVSKKWEDEWQKLPYISPYEDASHLLPNNDESDKWTVAVLHELLHILVPKKTERDNLLLLGEYLVLRSRFKRALLQHPGIFYMSAKIGTYTVVLKDGYKRGLLVENNPWMQMRNWYIHLMNMVKEDGKPVSVLGGRALSDSSDAEVEDASDDEYDDDEDENKSQRDDEYDDDEDENKSQKGVRKNVAGNRGRKARKMNLDVKGLPRKSEYDDDEDGNKSQRGILVLLEAYTTLKSDGPMVM
nr:protein root primordium defective 1 [Quercus suber]